MNLKNYPDGFNTFQTDFKLLGPIEMFWTDLKVSGLFQKGPDGHADAGNAELWNYVDICTNIPQ